MGTTFNCRCNKHTSIKMWISQTYLGSIEEDAKVVVYYFFESYSDFQSAFTKALMNHLSTMGKRVGKQAAVFVPNEDSLEPIKNEIRGIANNNEEFVRILNQKLPGLLFIDKRLLYFNSHSDPWVYVSLRPFVDGHTKERMSDFFSRIERVLLESGDVLNSIQNAGRWESLYKGFKARILFEPNFYGIGFRQSNLDDCEIISANLK